MFILCNRGSHFSFNPYTMLSDPRNKTVRYQLDIQIEFVREADDPAVYILNDAGKVHEF